MPCKIGGSIFVPIRTFIVNNGCKILFNRRGSRLFIQANDFSIFNRYVSFFIKGITTTTTHWHDNRSIVLLFLKRTLGPFLDMGSVTLLYFFVEAVGLKAKISDFHPEIGG